MTNTPWKTDNWLTSQWNFAPEVISEINFPEKIQIHDITLRDGEQQTGVAFNYDDKIRIAEALLKLEFTELRLVCQLYQKTTQEL